MYCCDVRQHVHNEWWIQLCTCRGLWPQLFQHFKICIFFFFAALMASINASKHLNMFHPMYAHFTVSVLQLTIV
jgi:hypothetical protein